MKRTLSTLLLLLGAFAPKGICQQDSFKSVTIKELTINELRKTSGTGTLGEEKGTWIFAGRKSEVIKMDSSDGNKALNNTREIIGRIPGLNVVETETGGFTSNGIGLRGLNPVQSIEMNVRQNGYNVAGDVMGYNETYYLPPMEAVERIEIARGAGSLQYGPQFGGMINYVTAQAPTDKKIEWHSSLTGGSYGMFNVFNSIGGTLKKFSYYAFFQYRHMEGFRTNSVNTQYTGMGRIAYKPSTRFNIVLEYSFLQNKIQMPGGLTDEWFAENYRGSYRSRNWLTTPWNILALNSDYRISDHTKMSFNISYGHKSRFLVWKNEDGGVASIDSFITAIGSYVPREVEKETMDNGSAEVRLMHHYRVKDKEQTLAAGVRGSFSKFHGQEGGEGTTGFDMNFATNGAPYENDVYFTNGNFAAFAENIFRFGKYVSITPGIRVEYLYSAASGYTTLQDTDALANINSSRSRTVLLGGMGIEAKPTTFSSIYFNASRAYRPIDYSSLVPFGSSSRIDPKLKDAQGYNAELGYRGNWRNRINWDVNGFLLFYQDKIGTVLATDATGAQYTLRTNVSNSLHLGVETYIEFNLIKLIKPTSKAGNLSVFNSLAYVHARYTKGTFDGKQVEYAPDIIERAGINYSIKGFAINVQISYQSKSYGDATNAEKSDEAVAGLIPSYYVIDCSASYRIGRFGINVGLNNLADRHYFTFRADEYPGPGIIPSIGRNFYAGFNVKL